jgi:excisionase family DNA binding protein
VKVKYPTISEAAFNKTMNINNPKDPVAGFLTQDHPEFLSVKTFAQILGVHWFSVWRWTVEKRIRFKQIKVGGKILIPVSELSRFQGPSE